MLEGGAAVQADAGDAEHGEIDRQHIAFLAARIVAGRVVDGADPAVGKGRGIEGRRRPGIRSEENTSELQSLMRISYAVFCLTKKIQKYLRLTKSTILCYKTL